MVEKVLRESPLFRGLAAAQLVQLEGCTHARTIADRIEIIRRDQPNESLFYLLSGTVRIGMRRAGQRETVLAILGAGEILGDISALDGHAASASVWTMEECSFLVIAGKDFLECVRGIPELAVNVMALHSRRMRRLTAQTEALATLDTEQRLARQLLLFAKDYGLPVSHEEARLMRLPEASDAAVRLPLRLTQGDLAALCSSSVKQINRAMTELQSHRIITVERGHRIVILAPAELRGFCPYDI